MPEVVLHTETTTADAHVPTQQVARRSRGAQRPVRKLLVAMLLALTAMAGLDVTGAAPASAATVGTTNCYSNTATSRIKTITGGTAAEVKNYIRVCITLRSTGRWTISSFTNSASHSQAMTWEWLDWNGNYQQAGNNYTWYTYYTKGSFRQCFPLGALPLCTGSKDVWVKHHFMVENNTTPMWYTWTGRS